jgi:hypothetical protein
MSGSRSEDLIRELARDLEPVQPIPRIRTVMAGVLALWFAVTAAGLAVLGLRPDLIEATFGGNGLVFVLIGLGLAGCGSVVAACAMGVPGRELLARSALCVSMLGMLVAVGVGALQLRTSSVTEAAVPFTGDLSCLAVAILVGLLPAVVVIRFAARSAPLHPALMALTTASGAAALGAITAYASCPHCVMRHLVVAHALAPAFGALLLTLPLLVVLKRLGNS